MSKKSVKISGPFVLWRSGKEITMQEPDKMQHEIVAFVGECPVTVAAIPIASSNGMDDQPRFEVSKSEYLRLGKLLAAAPKLLAALELLMETEDEIRDPGCSISIQARAAIAAATKGGK